MVLFIKFFEIIKIDVNNLTLLVFRKMAFYATKHIAHHFSDNFWNDKLKKTTSIFDFNCPIRVSLNY
jgi:hypothetical protein